MNQQQQLFKEACFNGTLTELSKQQNLKWIISDRCYVCGKKLTQEDFEIKYTYWKGCWAGTHKECQMADLVKECQTIDADCNDCKHFERKERVSNQIFKGNCLKLNKETTAYPNFCSGHECFEHRKN